MKAVASIALLSMMLAALAAPTGPVDPLSSTDVVVGRYDLLRTGVAMATGNIDQPVVLWTFATQGLVATGPLAADVDGDGALEILVGEFRLGDAAAASRLAYVLDTTGAVEYTIPMRFNPSPAAAADLDGDGRMEIVFSEGSHQNVNGEIGFRVFNGEDGSALWSFTSKNTVGEEGFFSSPAIADLDGDGLLDLVSGSMDKHVYALKGLDGSVLWSHPLEHYARNSAPLADIDGDGRLEVVVHTEAGVVHVYDAMTGAVDWEKKIGNIVSATPAVGDLDGDGGLDVVFSHVIAGGVAALRGDGTVMWQNTVHDFSYRSPTLVDVDGDGLLDVVEGDANDPSVTAYRGTDGAVLWDRGLAGGFAQGPLVTADIDGDGEMEILLGSSVALLALDARTGATEWQVPLPRAVGQPLVVDLDGDGDAEVLIAAGDGKLYAIGDADDLPFEPRTIGYWKHQCTVAVPKGDHVGIQGGFLAAIRAGSTVFSDLQTKDEACKILAGPKGNDMRARAEQQLLALWLNVVSGKVSDQAPVDLPMTGATTVGGAIAEVEGILTGSPSRADLERAKDICDALNNGLR